MTSQGCAVELWLAQWSASLEVHSTRPSRGRNFSVVPTRYAPVHLAVNEYTGQKYSVEGKVVKEFLATALIQLLPLKSEGTNALVLRRAPSPWSMPFNTSTKIFTWPKYCSLFSYVNNEYLVNYLMQIKSIHIFNIDHGVSMESQFLFNSYSLDPFGIQYVLL